MPRLALLATGGTIAGAGPQNAYRAGVIDARVLLDAVPRLAELAHWQAEQILSLDSRDIEPAHWLQIAARVQGLINTGEVDGIVITHGTDTLEETALALDLLLDAPIPVVLTAAMRPATSLSADGPQNLLQAACVALCPHARERGVLVVANDRVIAATDLAKQHTHAVEALQCQPGRQALGVLIGEHVRFDVPPRGARAPLQPQSAQLPRVDILYASAGAAPDLIDYALSAGARGLVLALSGHGSIPAGWRAGLAQATQRGVAIVRASRVAAGGVWPDCNEDDSATGCIAAGRHTPQQARVRLILELAASPQITRPDLATRFAQS